jgi:mono/diheme cytochrome c family protein
LRRSLAGITVGLLAAGSVQLWAQNQRTGAFFLPGNPKAGIQVFFNKGCARCHAVLGEGGRSAPDLARTPSSHLSAGTLLSSMWNHAPTMWERMRLENVALPQFQEKEMSDLFAFLYSASALDEPGNAERGRELLAEKRCVRCHAISGQGGRVGPDLERWADYRNPVSWIQAMWNHGPAMQSVMREQGLAWPQFRDSDLSDLIAYIREVTPRPRTRIYLRPADPESGRKLFQQKGCVHCHAIRGRGGRLGPDLAARGLPRTLGQFAADMWNHGPVMWSRMSSQQRVQRQLTSNQMANLISYLFAERYFETAGNPEHGRQLFTKKGCTSCHEGGSAPDLSQKRYASVNLLATALWNHGPLMLTAMEQQKIAWPYFDPGEIADLVEYFNRRKDSVGPGGKK